MKNLLLTALTALVSMFTRRVPTIHVRVQDYGVLGIRVYIAHRPTAEMFRSLTGNISLTKRHVQGLIGLGYRFQLDTYKPVDVPVWLAPFLHGAREVRDVATAFATGRARFIGESFDA